MSNDPMKHNSRTTRTKRCIPHIVTSRGIRTAALRLVGSLALTALASVLTNTAKAAERGETSGDSADARREPIMKNILSRPFENNRSMLGTVPFALSAYWLNERLPEADAAVIRVASPELPGVGSQKDEQGETHWHFYRQSFLSALSETSHTAVCNKFNTKEGVADFIAD
jgi:hypothetical protein